MKRLLGFTAALLLAVPFALAGGSSSHDGYSCSNACPLAQKANTHRSMGSEAVTVAKSAKSVRAIRFDRIRANLKKI